MGESKTLSTTQIAERVGGRLEGAGDLAIEGMQMIRDAQSHHLTYIGSSKYAQDWADSAAGAALVANGVTVSPGEGRALIWVDDVDLASVDLIKHFEPEPDRPPVGVHPSAVISDSATMGQGVRIGPLCVVGDNVTLGDGVILHAQVTVLNNSKVGDSTELWSGVVIRERCTIGRDCTLHPNVNIGGDGFGYRPAPDGSGLIKIPQVGVVEIGDSVEIGAGCCVDRGRLGATRIGNGTKLDNLVQIAHNCQIGRCVIIVGCTAIAGSTVIGDGALISGQVGINDHLTIGPGAQVGAGSIVLADVPAGQTAFGYPATEGRAQKRQLVMLKKLPELVKKLKRG
jgi:UDP-3-O-[3-hydroxymyristoyl] glucosamine N-acyltransferase